MIYGGDDLVSGPTTAGWGLSEARHNAGGVQCPGIVAYCQHLCTSNNSSLSEIYMTAYVFACVHASL